MTKNNVTRMAEEMKKPVVYEQPCLARPFPFTEFHLGKVIFRTASSGPVQQHVHV